MKNKTRRILIIDDPDSLLKLGRIIDDQAEKWSLSYVTSGRAALDILQNEKFDSVIAASNLSDISAEAFVETLSNAHPNIFRFLVRDDGKTDCSVAMTDHVHQFLTHLSNPEELQSTLEQVFRLDDFLGNADLQSVLAGIKTLPSLPSMYQEIRNRLRNPNASTKEIAEIIHSDPAMSAKILKVVNSGYFALNRKVSDVMQAASIIGLDTLTSLVLSEGLFSQFQRFKDKDFSMLNYVQHSMEVARLSKELAENEGMSDDVAEECYLAGLLHDLGMLIMIQNRFDDYEKVKSALENHKMTLDEAELEAFGTNHGAIGAYLLGLWGLPPSVVDAVAFHHRPSMTKSTHFSPMSVVHIASAISTSTSIKDEGLLTFAEKQLDTVHLSDIGMIDRVHEWHELLSATTSSN